MLRQARSSLHGVVPFVFWGDLRAMVVIMVWADDVSEGQRVDPGDATYTPVNMTLTAGEQFLVASIGGAVVGNAVVGNTVANSVGTWCSSTGRGDASASSLATYGTATYGSAARLQLHDTASGRTLVLKYTYIGDERMVVPESEPRQMES
jgi:hypothetical protein